MSASLVIDTSTSRTIVALVKDEQIIWQSFHDGATDHGNAVALLAKQALAAGVNPERVVVGMGPGPFTGLRVGISFARAFAAARNIPVIGICSLDAIVVDQAAYTVAIDARRKEIYWAKYQDGVRIEGPAVNFRQMSLDTSLISIRMYCVWCSSHNHRMSVSHFICADQMQLQLRIGHHDYLSRDDPSRYSRCGLP